MYYCNLAVIAAEIIQSAPDDRLRKSWLYHMNQTHGHTFITFPFIHLTYLFIYLFFTKWLQLFMVSEVKS